MAESTDGPPTEPAGELRIPLSLLRDRSYAASPRELLEAAVRIPDSTELEVTEYDVPPCSIHYEWTDPTGQAGWKIQLDIESDRPIPADDVGGDVRRVVERCAGLADSLAGIFEHVTVDD
jgi:hypothetical protein